MTYTPEQQAENRAKWVAALRSGEYKQGQNYLHPPASHCCLGVACEVAVRSGAIGHYDHGAIDLPDSVANWLGVARDGRLTDHIEDVNSLIDLNDVSGYTFEQIADVIESGGVRLAGQ